MILEGGFSFSNKQTNQGDFECDNHIYSKKKKKFIDAFKHHRKLEILFRLE